MRETIRVAEKGGRESARAIEIALLGVSIETPATFAPDLRGNLGSAWQLWIETHFVPVFAPTFADVHRLAGEGKWNEIVKIDGELDGRLSSAMRQRSLSAARQFLEGKSEMRSHREWIRLVEKIESGETPGHVLVVAALQTAMYRLALIPALTSYAWFEFQSGVKGSGEHSEVFLQIVPHLKLAVFEKDGDDTAAAENDDGSNHLRVV